MMRFLVLLVVLEFSFAFSKAQGSCIDSEANVGACVTFEACKELRKSFGGEIQLYLRDQLYSKSSCVSTRICCSAKESFPSHILDLLMKLPQPPHCGEFKLYPSIYRDGACMSENECSRVKDLLLIDSPSSQYECSSSDICCAFTKENFPKNFTKCLDKRQYMFNGVETLLYDHPWTVLLYYKHKNGKKNKPWCAGSLISNRYVLTAAHCVVNTRKWNLTGIRVGEYNTETEEDCNGLRFSRFKLCSKHRDIEIEKIIVHKDYDVNSAHNDIALIQISEEETQYMEYVRPICLPWNQNLQRNEDSSYFAVGLSETGQIRTVKGRVDLPNVPFEDCRKIIKKYERIINETQICAGGGEDQKDTCDGDSGGSLMMQSRPNELFGITSYGAFIKDDNKTKSCGRPGIPAVYTRVDQFLEWIANNIEENTEVTDETNKDHEREETNVKEEVNSVKLRFGGDDEQESLSSNKFHNHNIILSTLALTFVVLIAVLNCKLSSRDDQRENQSNPVQQQEQLVPMNTIITR